MLFTIRLLKGRSVLITYSQIDSKGVKLTVLDFGGNDRQDILLLHGLAGRGSEWKSTANWLSQYGRVVACDQRGHGRSRSGVTDFSRTAYVQDAIQVIEHYCRPPIVLIGQSMGGLNAFLAVAERPDLVKALIVVEATPEPDPNVQHNIRQWLESWPGPFRNLDDAKTFFGGDTLYSQTFAEALEKDEEGYWPAFNNEDMIHSLDDVVSQSYWSHWKEITCPSLIVDGGASVTSQSLLKKMATSIPRGQYTCIPEGGHDLHLDAPYEWQRTVEKFLNEVD